MQHVFKTEDMLFIACGWLTKRGGVLRWMKNNFVESNKDEQNIDDEKKQNANAEIKEL